MTIYKFNVDHSNPQVRKKFHELAEKMNFDIKNIGRPSTRDKSPEKLFISPAFMASGTSTLFLSPDPNKLCDRLKLLLQKRTIRKQF